MSVYLFCQQFFSKIACISFRNLGSRRLDPYHAQITQLEIAIHSLQNIIRLDIQMHHALVMKSFHSQTRVPQRPFNICLLKSSQTLSLFLVHEIA
jgi:hypothetical protein